MAKKCFLGLLLLLAVGCRVAVNHQPIQFASHSIKVKLDPASDRFSASDTITLTYHKNANSFYFFLDDSIEIKRIGVGFQDFEFDEILDFNPKKFGPSSDHLTNQKLVQVNFPKSLFPRHVDIWYTGCLDSLRQCEPEPSFWHPAQPDVLTPFELMALLPLDYQLECPAELKQITTNEDWRLYVWQQTEPSRYLALNVTDMYE